MKLKKRLLSVLLILTVMVTFMPAVTLTANAASKTSKKVYTVSSEKNEIGDNTKYTYNKKGFVTKTVSKYTKKNSYSDTSRTVTTTFKYNSKNRIKTKTTKDVSKETTYKTNKTTGKSTGKSLGTVTTTTTDVTKYTYKNGRAVKEVTTSTTVKSGSIKETNVSLGLSEVTQLSNGSYIAGHNYRNPDGSYNEENTSDNAYYYTGNVTAAVSTGTETTSYKDNGDGTYTETYSYESNDSNFKETPKKTYYRYDYDSDKYVVCSQSEDYDFYRTESVDVSVNAGSGDHYSRTRSEVITDKTVTTKTYKYDKKKRVKQAKISTVSTDGNTSVETESGRRSYTDEDEIYDEASDDYKYVDYTTTTDYSEKESGSSLYTETSSQVEKYTYDKNNRKKTTVVTDNGVRNSVETTENGRTESTEESSTKYSDGKTSSRKSSTTYTGANDITTTVYSNGNRATTVTSNPYSCTSIESSVNRDGRKSSSETKYDYTFFSNGGKMTSTVSKESYEYSDGSKSAEDRTSTMYEYDGSGQKYSYSTTYVENETSADGTPWTYKRSYAYYNDGTGEKYYYDSYKNGDDPEEVETNDAALKAAAERATAALTATGTPYVSTKNKAVKAKPSKATTNFVYDKQGNLKSAKTSGSRTEAETLRNETYGHDIYEFNADKALEEVETIVEHTYKKNRMKENTVRSGSNRVKSATTIGTSSSDRSTPDYDIGGRVTYTLKTKTIAKKAVRKDVELQQWLIQNPGCGSVVGLF